jgi:protein-tyrosine phosphatase
MLFKLLRANWFRLDILAIRDDGNDPLRPTIANACDWIEKARLNGGKVLVHCVSCTGRYPDKADKTASRS